MWRRTGVWPGFFGPSDVVPCAVARSSVRFATFLAWAFGAVTVVALWHRFGYACDLTDETFSIALPYRFALGDKPFVDEVSSAQTAGILVVPFVWLYVKLTGGTAGIVLFCRALHLAIKGVAALSVHAAAKRWVSPPSAIACAVVPFAFVPHSIPNVGYNVLGSTLLVVGAFTSAAAISKPSPPARQLVLAGIAYGLATFAYPPTALAAVTAGVLLLLCAPRDRLRTFGAFALGGVLAFVLVSPSLAFGGVKGVRTVMDFATGMPIPRGESKIWQVLHSFRDGAPELLVGSALALAVVRFSRSRFLASLLVPLVVTVAVFWFHKEAGNWKAGLFLVTFAGLCAPAMVLAVSRDSMLLRGGVLIVVPSLVAGTATAWASSNGTEMSCIGLWPAAVLFVVLAVAALERAHAERIWTMAPAALLVGVLLLRNYEYVYRDGPLETLTTQVKTGPMRGITTTAARASQFAELERVTHKHDRVGGRLFVPYEQPGIYLFSTMPPSSNTVWPLSFYGQESLLAYWRAHYTGRGMIIQVPTGGVGKIVDPVVEAPDRIIDHGTFFTVYRE
jgi:hypothetical protein